MLFDQQYIHHLPEWPRFAWDKDKLADLLAEVRHQQGRLFGHMEALGFDLQQEALLKTLTQDVLKSSEIEGERLDTSQVRSSLARRLGIDIGALKPADRHVDGVVEMMLDATRHYNTPLTEERIFNWQAALFPTGHSGLYRIQVGAWRSDATGPMQVVSGALGHEHIHYEAPAAGRLRKEMRKFLKWFNAPAQTDEVMKAALAHFWFVTIHPLEDGNGRIARAIADMALARSEKSPQRFYSMSAQIRQERSAYYDILESTQKGSIDVTRWMTWFLNCLGRAIASSQKMLSTVLEKAEVWESLRDFSLNDRQRMMINRLLDGFEGKLTTSKWALLAKCSQDTALRDMLELVQHGILARDSKGGRSTNYYLRTARQAPAGQLQSELTQSAGS